jgi:hypothetical protein
MTHVYANGAWYKGRMRFGLRHGYGCYHVPYDDITLLGIWKWDCFQWGIARHGHHSRFGYGHELYSGLLLNRTSPLCELRLYPRPCHAYTRKRKSRRQIDKISLLPPYKKRRFSPKI